MVARKTLCCLAIALFAHVALGQNSSTEIKWAPSLAAARQASAQFKVPLLVHFYGDACLPCRTLEKNVFSNAEVVHVLNRFFICVSINGSRDRAAMSEFEVHSYPTEVFLSPSGDKLHQCVSPQDVKEYLGMLERVAVMNRDRNAVSAAKQTNAASSVAQQATAPSGATSQNPNLDGQLPKLPPPGFATHSEETKPGFYTASGSAITQQQLQNGATSSKIVQSGPLTSNQQPVGITGSVQGSQSQVGFQPNISSTTPSASSLEGLPFPPLAGNGNSTPTETLPSLSPTSSTAISSYAKMPATNTATMPSVPNLNAVTSQQNRNGVSSPIWNGSSATSPSTTENPHFVPVSEAPNIIAKNSEALASSLANSAQQSLTGSVERGFSENTLPAFTVSTPVSTTSGSMTIATQPQLSNNNNFPQPTVANATAAIPVSATAAKTASEPKPMIDGFCPVSLRGKQWKKGSPSTAVKHRGMVFWLADQRCLEEFIKNPDYFTPILLGNDPMLLLTEGRMVAGSTQHGLFEDGIGPMFFTSAENRAQFRTNFEENMNAIVNIMTRAGGIQAAQGTQASQPGQPFNR